MPARPVKITVTPAVRRRVRRDQPFRHVANTRVHSCQRRSSVGRASPWLDGLVEPRGIFVLGIRISCGNGWILGRSRSACPRHCRLRKTSRLIASFSRRTGSANGKTEHDDIGSLSRRKFFVGISNIGNHPRRTYSPGSSSSSHRSLPRGALGEIRTPDPQIRSLLPDPLLLLTTELRRQTKRRAAPRQKRTHRIGAIRRPPEAISQERKRKKSRTDVCRICTRPPLK